MNIKSQVQKIWEERINQQVDSSFIFFGELKEFYGLKLNEDFVTSKALISSNEDLCEILAIESSLARSRRNKKLSDMCIERIENEISLKIRLSSFTYQFEKALSLFAKSLWIEAIHHFLKAYRLSLHNLAKAACLLNLILCYENLEISYTQSLSELKVLLAGLNGQLSLGIKAQIESLELRMKWRNADLSEKDFTDIEKKEISQINYFLVYLKQIPYLADPSTDQQIENFAKQNGHLFNKDFRLRTLTYQMSDNDKETGRLGDYIERIYLWTWKWIENPLRYNFDNLVLTVSDFPWDELAQAEQLSLDDQSLFILSFGWLCYFDQNFKSIYAQAIKKFKFSTHNLPLMNEKTFQDHLLSGKNIESMNVDLKNKLSQLLELKNQDQKSAVIHSSDMILINLTNQTVNSKGKKTLHSKSLSTALKILKENENISVESFYNQTLSAIEYDHYLHAPHISNMLYKLNQLVKFELSVKQKSGFIYMEGNKNFVQIQYGDIRTEMIMQNSLWMKTLQQLRINLSLVKNEKRSSSKKQFIKISSQFQLFTRLDIQSYLNISKTDASRLIQGWIEQKYISKKGFGKSTLYSVTKEHKESA